MLVRDEEWLVTDVQSTSDGLLLRAQGLSELVRGTTASFYDSIDTDITPLDPRDARLVGDNSAGYRRARLWLEATIRKTAIPLATPQLSASLGALADVLEYQQKAVRTALDPANLRPRILLADAVGLGKTLEIGMILAELIRRGRGDRILIVCPRHVLEQMQNEMWSRFAIPFVRLDSVGVQRVKQRIPATRNPFTYYNRVIVSIDTLKQDRFARDLRNHHWDAVVIDESHNVTNEATYNHRLASILAPNTDALILASATPHNGRRESFNALLRLLEPTAVDPTGNVSKDDLTRLVVRRHRHSPEVANVVGGDWAERRPPVNKLIAASPQENAVADELATTWLHPSRGHSPYSGANSSLFPWTMAKAFLSSPEAFRETLQGRLDRLAEATPDADRERQALTRLLELNAATFEHSAKYDALLQQLRELKVASEQRVVIFAERIATLHWLQQKLRRDLKLSDKAVRVLHGGLSDQEQMAIVDDFKRANSDIRVLVTGDVASEGVNLHKQCSQLIHYDIPWSLIRIEQRNGRIDRYGQKNPPQITTLLLDPASESFGGDLVVLTKLLQREEEAHTALGDAASLMGSYSVQAEEDAIRSVLAGQRDFDETVPSVDRVAQGGGLAALLASLAAAADEEQPGTPVEAPSENLYPRAVDFLREALLEYYKEPGATEEHGGVSWREHAAEGLVELTPPADLRQRLEVLPQSYLKERRVNETLRLATTPQVGRRLLESALADKQSTSSWPEAHYLGPLHPVLDWAADRALATVGRNQIFAVRGSVDVPTLLLSGILTNRRGQVVAASWVGMEFPMAGDGNLDFALPQFFATPGQLLAAVGFRESALNPGAPADLAALQPLVAKGVDTATAAMSSVMDDARRDALARIEAWNSRTVTWLDDTDALVNNRQLRERRASVQQEAELIDSMTPDRVLVRPLLLVLPEDHPVATGSTTTTSMEDANHGRQ